MNILIVKLSAVGDVVHTLPALAALRQLYPRDHITWVIEEAAADLIIGHPDLDGVIVFNRKLWISGIRRGRLKVVGRDVKSFFKTLRDRPYDLVIDFHGLFKSAVVVAASGGRRKLGYDSLQELSGLFYNEKIPEDMGKHAVERYLDFLSYLGAEREEPSFHIPTSSKNTGYVTALLQEQGIDRETTPFVAVNPVALWDTKLWDRRKFADLAARIVQECGLPVIFTGSLKEKSYITDILGLIPSKSIVDLAGKTSLKDLACLYGMAELVITTDSGPMHIAAAMETPVVALFGPTDPDRTGPYGEGHTVVRSSVPCSPCFRKQCDPCRCMESIGVDNVFDAVKETLGMKKIKKEGWPEERPEERKEG
ncbi:MAG: Lipopolysaccharide heptosyltransferase 1 [Syntrophus sp. SKADARSKE-3]|nr:Lipopolysaccharide heptosyltransferase 1 [Syntrophus sp. SKADARSKE-3]